MAYTTTTTTVSTTPVQIATVGDGGASIYSSAICQVGGANVATTGTNMGLTIPATTVVALPVMGGTESALYAVAASSATVTVLVAS